MSAYEAIVECDDEGLTLLEAQSGSYDPVEKIVIQTAFHSYEIDPARFCSLTIREIEP